MPIHAGQYRPRTPRAEPIQRGDQRRSLGLHVGQAEQPRQPDPRRGGHRCRCGGAGDARRTPIQTRTQRGQCHHGHRIGVVVGCQHVPDGRQGVRL